MAESFSPLQGCIDNCVAGILHTAKCYRAPKKSLLSIFGCYGCEADIFKGGKCTSSVHALQGIRPQPAACVPLYAQAHKAAQNLDPQELRWNVTAPYSTGMEIADSKHNLQSEQLIASGLQPPAAINPRHLRFWLQPNGEADFRQLWQRHSAPECDPGRQRGRQPRLADCKQGVTMSRADEQHKKQSPPSGINRQSGTDDSVDAEQETQPPNLSSKSGAVRRQMPQSFAGGQTLPADLVVLSNILIPVFPNGCSPHPSSLTASPCDASFASRVPVLSPESLEGLFRAEADPGQPQSSTSRIMRIQSSDLAYIEYALKCLRLAACTEELALHTINLVHTNQTDHKRAQTSVRLSVRSMQCLQARHRKGCEVWASDGAQGQHGGAAGHQRHVLEGAEWCKQARPSLPSIKGQGARPHPKHLTKCFDPF